GGGEDLGDREKEKEDSTKDIYPDHGAVGEFGTQGRMAEQVAEPLGQSDQENEEKHERPSPHQGQNGEDEEHANDARVAPVNAAEERHGVRTSTTRVAGGKVWGSNPPRTLGKPHRRI